MPGRDFLLKIGEAFVRALGAMPYVLHWHDGHFSQRGLFRIFSVMVVDDDGVLATCIDDDSRDVQLVHLDKIVKILFNELPSLVIPAAFETSISR